MELEPLKDTLRLAKRSLSAAVDALEKATARDELPNEHLATMLPELIDKVRAAESKKFDVVDDKPKRKRRSMHFP